MTAASVQIHYAGAALSSSQEVFWKVQLWDQDGKACRWSKVSSFTMGLLKPDDWKGEWIGNYLGNTNTAALLRKEITTDKPVKRALFYATAVGLYHITLDGKAVHDDCFAPGWTDFAKRRYYRCHDVTKTLKKEGEHAIGVELGDGWTRENGPGNVGMNSYSHYAYGAVAEWMFDTIAGIDHLGHGFQHFKLAPQPGGKLKHASATYYSPYGLIRSAWRQRGKRMTYEATIPPNTRACVHLPTRDLSAVKLDGKPLAHHVIEIQQDGGFTLPAGNYKFIW